MLTYGAYVNRTEALQKGVRESMKRHIIMIMWRSAASGMWYINRYPIPGLHDIAVEDTARFILPDGEVTKYE